MQSYGSPFQNEGSSTKEGVHATVEQEPRESCEPCHFYTKGCRVTDLKSERPASSITKKQIACSS